MNEIRYITGDATNPRGEGLKIIVHCCNNLGIWGAGFVMALSNKWVRPEVEYKNWKARNGEEKFARMLGSLQLVPVERDIIVGNIIGQHGVGRGEDGQPPVRYAAIREGLKHLLTLNRDFSVHMPRMGCGLAGGSWDQIERIINEVLIKKNIDVTVYDLE